MGVEEIIREMNKAAIDDSPKKKDSLLKESLMKNQNINVGNTAQ